MVGVVTTAAAMVAETKQAQEGHDIISTELGAV